MENILFDHIEKQYSAIAAVIGEEKYLELRKGIVSKISENTSFFYLENFLNMIIETLKRNPDEKIDIAHIVKIFNPGE